ncbi:MAG: methyltransferase domain-containing protein [Acidimicrobiia bacterium]
MKRDSINGDIITRADPSSAVDGVNNDRISEVYKGEIWADAAQERARRRINWMVSNVSGDTMLDIGTSQGIAAILLGREGFHVVGVDVQEDRIEYALCDLESESLATRDRVQFEVADAGDLPFGDATFDSVLLGEVIEHLLVPKRVLAEASRVLKPGGRIVITTPFGLLHHHDHRQTFFADDLYSLVSEFFGLRDAIVAERYFRIVGVKGAPDEPGVFERLTSQSRDAIVGIQEELAATKKHVSALEREDGGDETTLREADVARKELEATELKSYASAAEERAKRLSRDLDMERSVSRRLEAEAQSLKHEVAIAEWKIASTFQRRWWRLGQLLGKARKSPRAFLSLPIDVVKLAKYSPPTLPRPAPGLGGPEEPYAMGGSVIPALDLAAASVVSDLTYQLLEHEVLLFQLSEDGWSSELPSALPKLLIVDPDGIERWESDSIEKLFATARHLNIKIVLWSSGLRLPSSASLDRFEVVVSDDEPEGYEGEWVRPVGLIQPRIHNPQQTRPPSEDSSSVDLGRWRIGDRTFQDEASFLNFAKSHKVLILEHPAPRAAVARLVASGVTVIDPEAKHPWGFAAPVQNLDLTVQALVRSEVMRARLSHRHLRSLMRDHHVGNDMRRILAPELATRPDGLVDVMVPTKRPNNIENILDNLGRQTYSQRRLFLVAHGVELDRSKVQDLAAERGVEVAAIETVAESVVLGDVFNVGFGLTESELIAKMDDDDYYGSEYLWDLKSALDFSGADVTGKWAHYVYLTGSDVTIYRFKKYEHCFTDVVAISTLLMRRSVLDSETFPPMSYGSGSAFLRSIGAMGAKVFAADRWNYMYLRGGASDVNTFPVTDMKLLGNSDVVCRGVSLDEVTV